VDGVHPWIVNLLTALGFGIPVVVYFWVVARFGVNVIVNDQLTDVSVISASKGHIIPWGALWAQHTENRMFFPHLLDVVLADTVHFDIRFEEFLSASMLVAAAALLIWAHKRRAPRTPWLCYCPVALLSLSLVQYENTLWGFQIAWYLILLALSVAIVLLDRWTLSTWALTGAVAAGVVGSYSSFQGLFIWPVGLVLLYHRRRTWPQFVAWIACGSATTVLYFVGLDPNAGSPDHGYAIRHLWASVKFFLFAVGDVAGISVRVGAGNTAVLLYGVVVVALALVVVVCYGVRRDERGAGPVGVALIAFGLLFAASITQGRVLFGYWGASASRYTTFDLLVVVGVYLCVLGRPTLWPARSVEPSGPNAAATTSGPTTAPADRRGDLALRAVRWLVAVVVVGQIVVGIHSSGPDIRATNQGQQAAVQVSRHLDRSSDNYLGFFIAPWDPHPYIRHQLQTAERLHLSLYYGTPG
jgi:hypothetical protein